MYTNSVSFVDRSIDFCLTYLNRFELMVACWNYIPENRSHFLDIHTHLNEILSDNHREQPTVWFSNSSSPQTVTDRNK